MSVLLFRWGVGGAAAVGRPRVVGDSSDAAVSRRWRRRRRTKCSFYFIFFAYSLLLFPLYTFLNPKYPNTKPRLLDLKKTKGKKGRKTTFESVWKEVWCRCCRRSDSRKPVSETSSLCALNQIFFFFFAADSVPAFFVLCDLLLVLGTDVSSWCVKMIVVKIDVVICVDLVWCAILVVKLSQVLCKIVFGPCEFFGCRNCPPWLCLQVLLL